MRLNIDFNRGYITALDGIRGVAVTLVILYHCFSFAPIEIAKLVGLGWIGVDMFFVLSGFLITGILVDSKKATNYYKSFFIRRILRIFPLYYSVLICFFTITKLFQLKQFDNLWEIKVYFFTYTQNIFFSFNGWTGLVFNHLWSLAVEEQFYIFWPFVIFFLDSKKTLRVCVVGIIISIIIRFFSSYPFFYVFTIARMDALLIGAAVALLIRNNKEWLERYTLILFIISLIAIGCVFFLAKDTDYANPYWFKIGYTLVDIFFGCILLFPFDKGKIGLFFNKVLTTRIIMFLGKYSYGIYVYHWILYTLLHKRISDTIGFVIGKDTILNKYLTLLFLFSVILIVSYLSYHLFEKQFLKLKKYFSVRTIQNIH